MLSTLPELGNVVSLTEIKGTSELKRSKVGYQLKKQHGEGDMVTEVEIRGEGRCYATGFKDGERGHESRHVGGVQKLGKARNKFSLRAFRRNAGSPDDTLTSAH